jgi:hypothetical protein
MLKGLLTVALGAAAIGLARFVASAIAEERERRSALHVEHETTRWEGEGGNVVPSSSAASAA